MAMNQLLETISFHWPWVFLLLPMPWVLRWQLSSANNTLFSSSNQVLSTPFFKQIDQLEQTKKISNKYKSWLMYILWGLIVMGVARPFVILNEVPIVTKARDIMMAIDLSQSMQQNYLTGGRANRLDVVKAAADTFIERRPTDRVGLVFFSDRAYVQSPLTLDNQLVRELLKEAQVGLTGKNTAIGDAIAISLKRFKQSTGDTNENNDKSVKNTTEKKETESKAKKKLVGYDNKVLILLTDGANTAGVISPKSATEIAQKMGVKIYTIGVGKERNSYFNTRKELDDRLLKWVAKTTKGQFFRAQDKSALDRVYKAIDALEPNNKSQQYLKIKEEWFYYPVGLAFILALMWLFLSLILRFFRDIK